MTIKYQPRVLFTELWIADYFREVLFEFGFHHNVNANEQQIVSRLGLLELVKAKFSRMQLWHWLPSCDTVQDRSRLSRFSHQEHLVHTNLTKLTNLHNPLTSFQKCSRVQLPLLFSGRHLINVYQRRKVSFPSKMEKSTL